MWSGDLESLRAIVAVRRRALSELDVVEDAERVVRSAYERRLVDRMEQVRVKLVAAEDLLTLAQSGTSLAVIVNAEAHLCAMRQLAGVCSRELTAFQRDADAMAERHESRHAVLSQHIDRLERQIAQQVT